MICFLDLPYLYTRDSTLWVGRENKKEFDGSIGEDFLFVKNKYGNCSSGNLLVFLQDLL